MDEEAVLQQQLLALSAAVAGPVAVEEGVGGKAVGSSAAAEV